MRSFATAAAAATAVLSLAAAAQAQDIPDTPIPAGPPTLPVDTAPTPQPAAPTGQAALPPAPVAAPPLQAYQRVEVEDPVEPGAWDACTIVEAFQGAYEVSCNSTRSIRRDIHVRPIGGQPIARTAARPVTGPPFTRGSIVLASVMGLVDDWRLCIVQRNNVATTNGYDIQCAGSRYVVLPRWLRVDPDAPAS